MWVISRHFRLGDPFRLPFTLHFNSVVHTSPVLTPYCFAFLTGLDVWIWWYHWVCTSLSLPSQVNQGKKKSATLKVTSPWAVYPVYSWSLLYLLSTGISCILGVCFFASLTLPLVVRKYLVSCLSLFQRDTHTYISEETFLPTLLVKALRLFLLT